MMMRMKRVVGKEEEEERWKSGRVDGTNPSLLLLLLAGEREKFYDDPTRKLRVEKGTAVEVVGVEDIDSRGLMEELMLVDEREEVGVAAVAAAAVRAEDGVERDL